ncbi:STY1053 family phage-associated protein [Chitiniphilus shinanonensis]|uniref:STY1053 family phage-associated protein n=1 Tax=Chitiniphilus shinanonensis TaxID=553088 RepID=UPI003039BF57
MKTINVVTAFTLTKGDGEKISFEVGEHDVDDALAEHWYVKAHIEDPAAAKAARAARKGQHPGGDSQAAQSSSDPAADQKPAQPNS